MSISIDEYRSRLKASEPGRERIQQLKAQVHEAVRATAITGDANWDHFLALVEGRIAQYRGMIASKQAQLGDPTLVNAEQIMLLKVTLACLQASMGELEVVISLPKMLIESGSEAASKLAAMNIPDASPE